MRLTRKIREQIADAIYGYQGGYSAPDVGVVEDWWERSISGTPDGCFTAPSGACRHGEPSWLVELGLVEDNPAEHAPDVLAIVDRLNAYRAGSRDAEGTDIWGDVIERLPEYDPAATEAAHAQAGNPALRTIIVLTDGSVIDWSDETGDWYLGEDED